VEYRGWIKVRYSAADKRQQVQCCRQVTTSTVLQTSDNKYSAADKWQQVQCCRQMATSTVLQTSDNKYSATDKWQQVQCCRQVTTSTVLQTSDNKYISWPQKMERWASRKSERNGYKQKWQIPSKKSKTCRNEKIQYCKTHPNQILNLGLEIQEYFHTEPPCGKGNSRIRTHSPTQHYKISDINIKWLPTRTHNIMPTTLSHSCHCTKCLGESAKMRTHRLKGRKDLA